MIKSFLIFGISIITSIGQLHAHVHENNKYVHGEHNKSEERIQHYQVDKPQTDKEALAVLKDKSKAIEKKLLNNVVEYSNQLNIMFEYCEIFFRSNSDIKLEEHDNSKKIKVNWGQQYDVEQLMEHAIVHILRHRRQIESFIKLL